MEPSVIRVQGLIKDFNGLQAVRGIDFTVYAGEVFGFLGPNGAGKTTTIKMLCTLLRPTAGEAFVGGHSILKNPMQVRESIGIIFQDPTLDDRLTARENLKFHGILYGLRGAHLEKKIVEVLELVGLQDRKEERVKTFSGGMKRRLELARGLMHTPQILFLDEPTLGLDPQTRAHIWEHLRSLKKEGKFSLFLTTHYLEEAENCDRIAIIDHGKIVALDTPAKLKAQIGSDIVFLETEDDAAAEAFIKRRYDFPCSCSEGSVQVGVREAEKWLPVFLKETPVTVNRLFLQHPSLEDVFMKLTGNEIREEQGSWLDSAKTIIRRRRGA